MSNEQEIHEFCTWKYHTSFDQFHKSDVNGEQELPLFTFLKSQKGFKGFGKGPKALAMSLMLKKLHPDYQETSDIKWNFTKFLVDRQGNVVERFEPTISMKKVSKVVEALL